MDQYVGITGSAGASGTPVAFAQTAIAPGEIESLRSEISRYAATVDQLYARLDPVLKPEYDKQDKAMSHPMPVVSEIATLRSQVAENTTRLQGLLSRIDL